VRAVFNKCATGDLRQDAFERINHNLYRMIRMRAAQGQWQREEFTTEATRLLHRKHTLSKKMKLAHRLHRSQVDTLSGVT
jgi:hypothetical protein